MTRPDKLPCLMSLDHSLLRLSLTLVISLIPESPLMGFDLARCWVTPAQCWAERELRFSHVRGERTPHLQRCDPKPNHFKLCSFPILFVPSPSKQYCILVSITFLPVISPVYFMSSHLIFKFNNAPITVSAWHDLDLTYFVISPKLGLLAMSVNYIKGSCSY